MTESSPLLIKFAISAKEYRNLSYTLILQNKIIKGIAISLIVGLILAIGLSLNLQSNGESGYWRLVAFLVIGMALFPVTLRFVVSKRYKKDKNFQKEIQYTLHSEDVNIQTDTAVSNLNWDAFTRLVISGKWVLLYHQSGRANPIPRRALQDGKEKELIDLAELNGILIES